MRILALPEKFGLIKMDNIMEDSFWILVIIYIILKPGLNKIKKINMHQ